MMKTRGISLRYKILVALTALPFIGLLLFLVMAKNIFENDKIAYIFESSLSVSKTKAARVKAEVSSLLSVAQSVVYSYSPNTRTLAESGTYLFNQDSKFEAFQLYALSPDTGHYEKVISLDKGVGGKSAFQLDDDGSMKLLQDAVEKSIVVRRAIDGSSGVLLAIRFGDVADAKHVVALAKVKAQEIVETFAGDGGFISSLTYDGGEVLFGPAARGSAPEVKSVWDQLTTKRAPEGIAEVHSEQGDVFLASFVHVGIADLRVVSLVDRDKALQAVTTLIRKSVLFFFALISFTIIIGVLASSKLTSALRRLLVATQKVAEGDFDVRVSLNAKDEVGSLANSFNTMAIEVSRLMRETADKARMESELATARTVQETLFPENNATIGPVKIAGHYQPASECGGDWWYYCENSGKVYLWIGDATGHGAPAALLTSAARAVASVIQGGPPIGPAQALGILNRAIYDASKGRMMMTFFLAVIDKQTGTMEYANASHEAPLLLKKSDEEPSRSDYIPLNDVNNPRLGEKPDIEFKATSVQLDSGDRIVFYTDGVTDVKDTEQKAWGERKFLKSLSRELHANQTVDTALDGVLRTISDYRQQTPLDDDVTLIVCSYQEAA